MFNFILIIGITLLTVGLAVVLSKIGGGRIQKRGGSGQ